jgi:hypothetical protein
MELSGSVANVLVFRCIAVLVVVEHGYRTTTGQRQSLMIFCTRYSSLEVLMGVWFGTKQALPTMH